MVLFGTPSTNLILASWIDKLPVEWDDEKLFVNGKSYSAKTHVLAMIYSMPLAPQSYVVINSGFTFREYAKIEQCQASPHAAGLGGHRRYRRGDERTAREDC